MTRDQASDRASGLPPGVAAAVRDALATARALHALHEAVAQDQCADQAQPDAE